MERRFFDIDAIAAALHGFRVAFPEINERLEMKREDVSEMMVEHLVEAYLFLNDLLARDVDLFTPAGIHSLLEMNHIVLCGADPDRRMEYYHHIAETRKRFLVRVKPIKAWVLDNRESAHPVKLASGFYSRSLSQPQLFIEGNHRTGNILLNYLLVSRGLPPYVVTTETAKEYLDISGDIKFTDKDKALEHRFRMPGHRKRFRSFLSAHCDERFLAD